MSIHRVRTVGYGKRAASWDVVVAALLPIFITNYRDRSEFF